MKMIVMIENTYVLEVNIRVQFQAKNLITKINKINIFLKNLENLI
jgi:hypothetical protein